MSRRRDREDELQHVVDLTHPDALTEISEGKSSGRISISHCGTSSCCRHMKVSLTGPDRIDRTWDSWEPETWNPPLPDHLRATVMSELYDAAILLPAGCTNVQVTFHVKYGDDAWAVDRKDPDLPWCKDQDGKHFHEIFRVQAGELDVDLRFLFWGTSLHAYIAGARDFARLVPGPNETWPADGSGVASLVWGTRKFERQLVKNAFERTKVVAEPSRFSLHERFPAVDPRAFTSGGEYWADLVRLLRSEAEVPARSVVCIMDWMVTLDVPLVPSSGNNHNNTLLDILKELAKRGVNVYMLIWDDPDGHAQTGAQDAVEKLKQAASTDSNFASYVHYSLNHNRGGGWSYLGFSHHMKLVAVCTKDKGTTAYVGGIDIARNRFDDDKKVVFASEVKTKELKFVHEAHVFNGYLQHQLTKEQWTADKEAARMPWQDVQVRCGGPAAECVAQIFVKYWEAANKGEKLSLSFGASTAVYVQPSAAEDHVKVLHYARGGQPILDAMREAIRNAEKFIYIENQFFVGARRSNGTVTEDDDDDAGPQNDIPSAIVDVIINQVVKKQNKDFCVTIVMPLWPDRGNGGAYARRGYRTIMWHHIETRKWMEAELVRGGIKQDDVAKHLSFLWLARRVTTAGSRHIDLPIYVHSKAMLVDDKVGIVGSANINDRSLSGIRDSEIAIMVQSADFATGLRKKLWSEHLQVAEKDVPERGPFAITAESGSRFRPMPADGSCILTIDGVHEKPGASVVTNPACYMFE